MVQPHLLFISGVEIAFILVFVLLIFGADKIPEIARGLGKGLRQVKDATNDIKSEISKSADKQGVNLDVTKDIGKNASKNLKQIKDDVEDFGGSIKRNL
ncbi:twin-arginine translocase TatA/TatE family subunit [Flavobacteriaceae bacterium]|nr:twin-arginine translocase TatA/TatE family subunit [Flavobacteriaceae bacterium]